MISFHYCVVFNGIIEPVSITLSMCTSSDSSRNIALNREAWQSSDGHWDAPASLAFDGNTNPNYNAGTTTHTNKDNQPFIAVDLAERYLIDHVLVTNTDVMREYSISGTLTIWFVARLAPILYTGPRGMNFNSIWIKVQQLLNRKK